jgi:hypothetical protein
MQTALSLLVDASKKNGSKVPEILFEELLDILSEADEYSSDQLKVIIAKKIESHLVT